MTPDLSFLLAALCLFLTVAGCGYFYFLWRIFQVRAEADMIQKQLDTIAEETAEIQN